MKVYQCLHKYNPYIAHFEEKYKPIKNNLSFTEWRNLILNDGYFNSYILQPSTEDHSSEVFFTIWNYEALQYKWADENGLKTNDLDEIKLAQIEAFNPDVFYNLSPNYDNDFIRKIANKKDLIKVCWDSIITNIPSLHEEYDLRFSLFNPFVKYWNQQGYLSFLLSPAFSPEWEELNRKSKDIDILYYGQYTEYFFSKRNKILFDLAKWVNKKDINFRFYLQFASKRKPLIDVWGLRNISRWLPVAPKIIVENALAPIYGKKLYETIARSRIVINGFGNYNGLFKDNLRNYETTGCGAFLIGEDGIYPEHFIPNIDFYTYRSSSELFEKIEKVLSLPDKGLKASETTREKLKSIYSKENQWQSFNNAINSL